MTWMQRSIVVVPIDISDDSLAALETAACHVDDRANLRVIHVLPVLEPAEPGVIWHTIDDQSRARHADEALREALAKRGFEDLEIVTRFGDPGREIVRYAEEVEAGLIVIPSHGRSGWQRLLLGSVADRVVHMAHCPVLVLKN